MGVVGSFRETSRLAMMRVSGTGYLVGELAAGEGGVVLLGGNAGR